MAKTIRLGSIFSRDNDTVAVELTRENCRVEDLWGRTLWLRKTISADKADELGTSALRSVTEVVDTDGVKRNRFEVSARRMSLSEVLAWIQKWDILGDHDERLPVNQRTLGEFAQPVFQAIEKVVRLHKKEFGIDEDEEDLTGPLASSTNPTDPEVDATSTPASDDSIAS